MTLMKYLISFFWIFSAFSQSNFNQMNEASLKKIPIAKRITENRTFQIQTAVNSELNVQFFINPNFKTNEKNYEIEFFNCETKQLNERCTSLFQSKINQNSFQYPLKRFKNVTLQSSILMVIKKINSNPLNPSKVVKISFFSLYSFLINLTESFSKKIFILKNVDPSLDLKIGFQLTSEYSEDLEENHILNLMLNLSKHFGKSLSSLLEADTGVSEKYTNIQHILKVIQIYEEQKSCLDWKNLETSLIRQNIKNPDLFMKTVFILHDIGKPLAVKSGHKERQHQYTIPILIKVMKELGYNPEEIQLAVSLVDHEIFGDLLRKKSNIQTLNIQMNKLYKQTNLKKEDFITLQEIFYSSDAGSYPQLYQNVFKRSDNGCIIPSILEGKINPLYLNFLKTFNKMN